MPESIERLRATVEHLAAIERPSASDGEKRAAEWILERLNGSSADARIEEERAHGTYWMPLGLMTAAAGLAGLAAARGGRGARALAIGIGAAAAAGVADDVSGGPHVVMFIGRDGQIRDERTFLAGNVLLWNQDLLLLRLEGDLTRDEAVKLAESAR